MLTRAAKLFLNLHRVMLNDVPLPVIDTSPPPDEKVALLSCAHINIASD